MPGAGLANVTVSDTIPDGLRLVSDSIGYLLVNGDTKQLADTYLVGDTITWPSFATLPAGTNVVYLLRCGRSAGWHLYGHL